MLNPGKLDKELKDAGIKISGCNSNGIVWDEDNNEIQDRKDVKAIIDKHDPTPDTEPPLIEERLAKVEEELATYKTKVDTIETELKK